MCLLLLSVLAEASVQLPATLDKSNVSTVSADMTYYNNDYFNFGPTDGGDTIRWAEWTINLKYPGKYVISEIGYCENGHSYALRLKNGNTIVSSFTAVDVGHWGGGNQSYTQGSKWDLSDVSAGEYTLLVKNITEFGQPKLKSLTLEYDGEIPEDQDSIPDPDPNGAQVDYTVDDLSIFANPERGIITQLEHVVTVDEPYCVKGNEGTINNHIANDNGSLILVLYYLDNYKNAGTIPDAILDAFDEDMEVLRNKGLKAIIRYAYTADNTGEIGYDAPLDIVKQHINLYKRHWEENADVIYVFQAGIVGAWGEWFYTSNYGNKIDTINSSRRALIDTLLAAIPADRYLQIRTPLFKTTYIGDEKALTTAEAYSGTPRARLGHHNDAVLDKYGKDQGTFTDTAKQKPWLAKETMYVPIGGESCILDANLAATNTTYEKTIAELSRLHWTFIKGDYSTVVTGPWRENGTMNELKRRLGYRYQLVNGIYTQEATAGGTMSVYMNIRNTGFAPLYNERPVYIVLKNGSRKYTIPMAADPRRWKPNGVVTTVSEVLNVPAGIVNGTYQMYLYMPDAYESIASNSKYAVRFANEDIWNETTGMNNLNASITISGGAEPTPIGVQLPATLDKSNMSAVSDDKWYDTDYFNFGDDWGVDGSDGTNLSRWIEWNVYLGIPAEYTISEVGYYPNGHNYLLQLLDGNTVVSEFTTAQSWASGAQTITQSTTWDLSGVPVGEYTLRVKNAMSNGKPKLKSITLQCEMPTYTITWKDGNGNTLKTEQVAEGIVPSYTGATPTRQTDGCTEYTFSGWSPAIVAATGNATYTATFDETTSEYTITIETNDSSMGSVSVEF